MLLKNLMEDKQLDFNQPLLSVRRFTSPATASESEGNKKTDNSTPKIPCPPIYRSELKSGPVRNPGTVPFVWEKTPGRPKEGSNLQTLALEQPPIAPKLPPGRALNHKQQSSRKGSDGKTFAPSQTEIAFLSSQSVSCSTGNEAKYESTNGGMEETRSCSSKDSDKAYVDALDTLSRTESFFMNCSISGVSGLDGPDIKPSGISSTDPQTWDFMMGRFLPAAKAVALETPPYASRKQPIAREPPRQIKKIVIVDKKQPPHRCSLNKFPNHVQHDWSEESENEDDYSRSQNSSAKLCGIFPQFLLNNSFCLLNPIPGMKIQAKRMVKQAHSVRRRQATSSYLRSCNEIENEHSDVAWEKALMDIAQTEELIKEKNNIKSGSSQESHRSDCQMPDGASLFRHLQGNDVSSYPSQISQLVEKGFLGIPGTAKNFRVNGGDPLKRGRKNFEELLASESINQESASASPVVEKTVYVDSVRQLISSNSYFSARTALTQCMEDDLDVLVKPGEKETPSVDSSFQDKDIKCLNGAVEEKTAVQHQSVESVGPYSVLSPERFAPNMQVNATNGSRRDQDLIQDYSKLTGLKAADNGKDDVESQVNFKISQISRGLVQGSNTCTNSKVAERRKIDLESHLQMKSSNQEGSHDRYLKLPLAPPLPNAPSESWLKRTLPTVSSRNSSFRSCLSTCNYTGTQANTAPSGDPKWEIMVRSSKVHHGHLRFSEEQLLPIPEG